VVKEFDCCQLSLWLFFSKGYIITSGPSNFVAWNSVFYHCICTHTDTRPVLLAAKLGHSANQSFFRQTHTHIPDLSGKLKKTW